MPKSWSSALQPMWLTTRMRAIHRMQVNISWAVLMYWRPSVHTSGWNKGTAHWIMSSMLISRSQPSGESKSQPADDVVAAGAASMSMFVGNDARTEVLHSPDKSLIAAAVLAMSSRKLARRNRTQTESTTSMPAHCDGNTPAIPIDEA